MLGHCETHQGQTRLAVLGMPAPGESLKNVNGGIIQHFPAGPARCVLWKYPVLTDDNGSAPLEHLGCEKQYLLLSAREIIVFFRQKFYSRLPTYDILRVVYALSLIHI